MSLPTKASFETTGFGVRKRELVIIGVALAGTLFILIIPFAAIFARIILGTMVMAAGILYAFWRIRKYWTVEEWIINKIKYQSRTRKFIKGGAFITQNHAVAVEGTLPEKPAREYQPASFTLPSWLTPQSNFQLIGYVLSFAALVIFFAWVGTDGVAVMQYQMQQILTGIKGGF